MGTALGAGSVRIARARWHIVLDAWLTGGARVWEEAWGASWLWPGSRRDRLRDRLPCFALRCNRRHRGDLGALRRSENGSSRCSCVGGLARQEGVQRLFDGTKGDLAGKERRKVLRAQHGLDGGELPGTVA